MSEFRLGEFNSDFPFSSNSDVVSESTFSPSDLSGLKWWLDASDSSTITLNGSDVSQWNDKSTSGNNVVQATALNQPAYSLALQNGLNVVSFTNPNFMATSGAVDFDTNDIESTVFIVTKGDSSVTGNQTLIGTASSVGNSGTLMNMQGGAPNGQTRYLHRQPPGMAGGDSLVTAAGTVPDATAILLCYERIHNINQEAFLSGSSIGSISPSAGNHTSNITVGIGRLTPFLSDRYLEGFIAEIVMYDRSLNSAETLQVDTYLKAKWSV